MISPDRQQDPVDALPCRLHGTAWHNPYRVWPVESGRASSFHEPSRWNAPCCRARRDELSTAECLDLVEQLAAIGVKEVSLIGGEAYLRSDWLEVVAALRAHGIDTNLTTGGRQLTAARARAAKDAGLMTASVSIDGDEEVHDQLRGVRGAYRSALDAMEALRDAGVPVAANSQINRLSFPLLPQILDVLVDQQAHGWQLMLTAAMGRAADEPELLLQPYDLLELFPMLADLKARAEPAGVRLFPGNNLGYFGPLEHVLRDRFGGQHCAGCSAGRSVLGIEADGTIKGCPSLPTETWTAGNIRDHRLVDLWERAEPIRFTRTRTVDDLWGFCRSCYYADTCRAGCTWTSDVLLGRPGNNPIATTALLSSQLEGSVSAWFKPRPLLSRPSTRGALTWS